jgi:hypothetical protein
MLNKIICYIFGHNGVFNDKYFPDFYAPIITRWEHTASCLRCGDVKKDIWEWDKDTGEFVNSKGN